VAAPPESLEALVKDELRGPVSELVRRLVPELVAEALNGTADSTEGTPPAPPRNAQERTNACAPIPESPPASTKTCSLCGIAKSLDHFARGRRQCRACRRAYERRRLAERAREQDDAEPHPAASPQTGRKGALSRERDNVWRERRAALIDEARQNGVTYETRGDRTFTVLHLAALGEPPGASP
jgi:hypothetical protein